MTYPTWPASLPQKPDYNGWTESPQKQAVGFKPDVGGMLERRRSSATMSICRASFTMTNDQVETFLSFFNDDMAAGVLPFLWNHPMQGTEETWKCISDPETSPYQFDHQRVTLELQRLP